MIRTNQLFLEKIEEGLTVTVHWLGRGCSASLFLNKDLRLKQRAHIVDAFIADTHFYRFGAFIAG